MVCVGACLHRYARDGALRRRMYQEVNTTPVENLDVLERLIEVSWYIYIYIAGLFIYIIYTRFILYTSIHVALQYVYNTM